MKDLLIIDDFSLRQTAFAAADKLIQKIEQLEDSLKVFNTDDQRLFSSWFTAAFEKEQSIIAKLRDDYLELARFHNRMVAFAEMTDCSLQQAWLFLTDEERRYREGTELDRKKIDEERKVRDAFMRGQTGGESREDKNTKTPLELIAMLTDEALTESCREYKRAHAMLWEILELAYTTPQKLLILRVWPFLPEHHQTAFRKDFAKQTNYSFDRLLDELRELAAEAEKSDGDDSRVSYNISQEDPAETENLKLLYRKLVRRLHPDLQTEGPAPWHAKIWNRVQQAYEKEDYAQLTTLWHFVLIRGRALNELSMSELLASQTLLETELKQMSQETKRFKKLSAWGFSRRKSHESLKKKLEKPMLKQIETIEAEIAELRDQHDFLAVLARAELIAPRSKKREARIERNQARRGRRSRSRDRFNSY